MGYRSYSALISGFLVSYCLATDLVQSKTAECHTVEDLFNALANEAIQEAVIFKHLSFADIPVAASLPVVLQRNFSFSGAYADQKLWPTLDSAYRVDVVLLGPGVTLTVTRLAVWRWRLVPHFQAFGADWIRGNGTAMAPALLFAENAALIQRTCLPLSMIMVSNNGVPRPAAVPGQQVAGRLPQSPDCVNSSSVPAMRRCWPSIGMYNNTATYATNLDSFGKAVPAGYILWGLDCYYLCETVMTDECVAERGGPVGCFNSMFIAGKPPPPPPSPPSLLPPPPPAAAPSAASGSHRSLLAPLLGGILGGVTAIVFTIVLVVLIARARSRRQTSQTLAGAAYKVKMERAACSGATLNGVPRQDYNGLEDGPTKLSSTTSPHMGSLKTEYSNLETPITGARATGLGLELVPVTPLTPVSPHINLSVRLGTADNEVQLLPTVLGKGACGRVVEGLYRGERVAVKLLDTGLAPSGVAVPADKLTPSAAAVVLEAAQPAAAVAAAAEVAVAVGCSKEADAGADGEPQAGEDAAKAAAAGSGASVKEDGARGPDAAGTAGLVFGQEVAVLARCCHPNIVRLLAASLRPSRLCLVMEIMETSLERLMYGGGGVASCGGTARAATLLPLPKVLHIAAQVARALAYLHPTVLHRDLKPANVLISAADSDQPVVKLADFGLSRLQQSVLVTVNPEVGTTPYVAPEAFDVSNFIITDKADIYSLGVMMWEMLSGLRPWDSMTHVQIAFTVTLQRERLPLDVFPAQRCPRKLMALMQACWDPEPDRRPAAAEAAKILALVQQDLATRGLDGGGRRG